MGVNVLVGGQLDYLRTQYERLLRKQVAQECYKLEYLLGQLKKLETQEQWETRKHRNVFRAGECGNHRRRSQRLQRVPWVRTASIRVRSPQEKREQAVLPWLSEDVWSREGLYFMARRSMLPRVWSAQCMNFRNDWPGDNHRPPRGQCVRPGRNNLRCFLDGGAACLHSPISGQGRRYCQ